VPLMKSLRVVMAVSFRFMIAPARYARLPGAVHDAGRPCACGY
jgi:hypothetical protein